MDEKPNRRDTNEYIGKANDSMVNPTSNKKGYIFEVELEYPDDL